MGRDAYFGQEILKRDGKFIGFNAGYGHYAEHESKYMGLEQKKHNKIIDTNRKHPFNGEIVENPDAVKKIELNDGRVWLTNDWMEYATIIGKPEEQRKEALKNYITKENYEPCEIIAMWNAGFGSLYGGNFDLISTDELSAELLRNLYDEIQKGNVAISSDYSFMFKTRGLSFVLLDQLSEEDLKKKELIDNYSQISAQFQREYQEYLKKEGLHGESGAFHGGCKYPAEFWNVQVQALKGNVKRRRHA